MATYTSNAITTTNAYINYTITVEENSQNIVGNYSTVTVYVRCFRTNSGYTTYGTGTVACIIDGTRYTSKITSSQKITKSGIILFARTVNVYHDDDGNKTLSCVVSIDHSQFNAYSSNGRFECGLTYIVRQSLISAESGVLGEKQTLTVLRNNPDYTHTITYTCGSASGTICEKSNETSVEFTPPLALAEQNPTGTTVAISYLIESFAGDESRGTRSATVAYSMPESVAPKCALSVSDANGYATSYGAYIKGKSALALTITPTPAYGSDIVSYNATVDGATYTAQSVTTEVLKSSGEVTISASVTDQRNRSGSTSRTINVLDYAAPMISSLKVSRCNVNGVNSSSGEYAKLTFSNEVVPLNNKNKAIYTLEYKKASETSYKTLSLSVFSGVYSNQGASYIVPSVFDASSTYDIILRIEDDFGSASKTAVCPSASKLWSALRKGLGFAFGKVAEFEGVFEVAFKTKLTGGILHPDPNAGTDLDTLTTPNIYRLIASREYINAPENEVEAVLKVTGDATALRQRFNVIDKVNPRAYERAYAENAWGEWIDLDAFMLTETNASIASIQTEIKKIQNQMMLAAYPVGSIYITLNEEEPAVLFGGTWERVQDCFLFASGERNAGGFGGSEFIEFNIPAHAHTITTRNNVAFQASAVVEGKYDIPIVGTTNQSSAQTEQVWHMPPYTVVHMWKRVPDPIPENYEAFLDNDGLSVYDVDGNEFMVEVG